MNRRTLVAVALLAVATGASAQQHPYGPPTVTPPYDSIVMTEPVAGSDIPVDTDDFAKDTEKKEIARAMMKMTGEINKTYFKGEQRMGCISCHNGAEEPKKP